MAQPQLSVRSARARDLAHMLAKRERRTVAQVVEKALEAYADKAQAEPAAAYYARMARDASADIDLELIIDEHRAPHAGMDL
jgi:hypothetical protein